MTAPQVLTPDVAIVGGGPSGLTAATTLATRLPGEVLVLERETQPGGIPRHSNHTGYGLRDLRRSLTGPKYAARLAAAATAAGADLHTEAMVSHLAEDRTLTVTTPHGVQLVRPRALILATGARERPRPARRIAGDRPAGVYTTGHLQNLVHLQHRTPGRRAVVIGAELVSWSAVLTLRESGCDTVLMTTSYHRSESYQAFSAVGRALLRVPVAPRTRLVAIEGRHRVEAVQIQDLRTGTVRRVACDTVVLTGDWIPDNELARSAGIDLATASKSPVVDTTLRTSAPGIFAIGNLAHPVDTADVAALDGRHVAVGVLRWLHHGETREAGVPLAVEAPLRWIAPSHLAVDDQQPARGRLLTWCDAFIARPVVVVRQGGRTIARHRVPWPAAPGRVFRIPARFLDTVDRRGAEVRIGLE
jgi:thioredoxin reductase